MKCCKIITCWFGPRRPHGSNSPLTGEKALELLKISLSYDMKLDQGIYCDTILINHGGDYDPAQEFLQNINGSPTNNNNGKIIVHDAPNIGAAFGGFHQGFEKYKDEYDYFLFLEDDVFLIQDNIFKEAISILDNDDNIGFVSLTVIGLGGDHATGGCGFSSREKMMLNWNWHNQQLPHHNGEVTKDDMMPAQKSEKEFTYCFTKNGYGISHIPNVSLYPVNWAKHRPQTSARRRLKNDNGNYIYQVGL